MRPICFFRRFWSRFLASVEARAAEALLRGDRPLTALPLAERAAARRPDCFDYQLLLARIRLRAGILAGAAAAFDAARRIDPMRFRIHALPESWFVDMALRMQRAAQPVAERPRAGGARPPSEEREPCPDDCSSDNERERFRRLGPVRLEEALGVDWDELARRLTGDSD